MPSGPAHQPLRSVVDSVRGRRLLWELLTPLHAVEPWWSLTLDGVPVPNDDVVLPSLHELVGVVEDRGLSVSDLHIALAATVDTARYWQPPDPIEYVLAGSAVRTALAALAAVVAAVTPGWWSSPLDVATQHRVRWVDDRSANRSDVQPPSLAAWRASMLADEVRFAAVHEQSDRPWSGEWWSTPGYLLPSTTRAARALPAVHLALVEDESGWTAADVEPVAVDPAARVLEVTSAADWAALVARYPLEVTHSRRHDWHRTTGRLGRWFLPDFAAVADDYDGVHVTVAGYLDTAGDAVPVPGLPGGATVLAGWSPDQTWWLRPDQLTAEPPRRWQRVSDADSPWEWERRT